MRAGFFDATQAAQDRAAVVVGFGIIGPVFQGVFVCCNRLPQLPRLRIGVPQIVARLHVIWLQRDCFLILANCILQSSRPRKRSCIIVMRLLEVRLQAHSGLKMQDGHLNLSDLPKRVAETAVRLTVLGIDAQRRVKRRDRVGEPSGA